jgi:hypothetical protein
VYIFKRLCKESFINDEDIRSNMTLSKKSRICFVFAASVLITSIVVYEPALAQMQSFLLYQHPSMGFSAQFPNDWYTIDTGTGVLFLSPPESPSDAQPERLLITVIPNVNTPISQSADMVPDILSQMLEDFELISSQPITINGNIAHMYLFTYYDLYFGPTLVQDIVMQDGFNTYGLTYYAEPSNFELYLPTIDTMIYSLQTSTTPVSPATPPLGTDVGADDMVDMLGDEAEVSPEVAAGLRSMIEMESQTNSEIIANMK